MVSEVALSFMFIAAMAARLTAGSPLPALPSKTNGPASFLGVIGPSTRGDGSERDEPSPWGLGVRTDECLCIVESS